jgi:uncharacterized protein
VRLVADTNTVVSGLLWPGPQRRLLELARLRLLTLFTTVPLLLELDNVLKRPKFAERLRAADVTATDLVLGYAALAVIVDPATIEPHIDADPDDDAVLACALAAKADVIVSGDRHLLTLAAYAMIPILPVATLLDQLDL